MKKNIKMMTFAICLSISACVTASPRYLITHNNTNLESNAYVQGVMPSRYPSRAYSNNQVSWLEVRVACTGRTTNGQCPALIRLGTGANDGITPIDLGFVYMDLNTGLITPDTLHAYGYTLTVNGPGETTLSQD